MLYVVVVFLVLVVTCCALEIVCLGALPRGGLESGGDDLVCEVYSDHVGVVYVDTCCCYVGVDCGEHLEPRVAKVVCGREEGRME